jgi:mersacidin/lichenicidin family type 2 lantibiotic
MKLDVVRAWKDETYRQSLNDEQLNTLPVNPAGALELTDTDLESVCGGSALVPVYGGDANEHWHGHERVIVRTVTIVKKEIIHSYTLVICEINIYSVDIAVNGFTFASSFSQICKKHE